METMDINFIDDYIEDLVIDYNRQLSIKQRDQYNQNNKRIKCKNYSFYNLLIGYKDLFMYKLCLTHKELEKNKISKDIRNIML